MKRPRGRPPVEDGKTTIRLSRECKAMVVALSQLDVETRGQPAYLSRVVEEAIRALAKAKGVRP